MIKFAMSLLILGLILAITLCGCGGGNGGNGKQDGPKVGLNGVYYMAELNINSGGESSSISEIIFDGNGNFTFEQIYGDKDGGNQNQSGSGAYEVKVDGSCTFTIDGEVTDARLSSDSRTFVAARINSKSVHNVSVGVKAGTGGFSKASLNGVYYMSGLNINSDGESSSISEIIFDGNGNFTFEQIYGDKDGGNQNQSGSGAYEVKVDGSCTFTIDGEVTDARLSSDSRTFVAARINSKSVHNVSVGVKAGTGGFSKASLNGVYYMSGLNINSGGESSAITKITFDGNKNFTYEQINSESAEPQTGSGTYEVDADGTFTITEGDKVTDGRLSTDSRTFVAARTNSTSVHNVSVGVKH